MKLNSLKIELILFLVCAAAPCARCQGTFQNLDFESALIILDPTNPFYPHAVPVEAALPGWTAYAAGPAYPDILYNDVTINAAAISIHDSASIYVHILQGSYTVFLQPNVPGYTTFPAIGQVGTMPATAHSLQFYAGGNPSVSFSGQQLGLVVLGTTPTYGIFAADITAFAGRTGELRFWGETTIDNIVLSSQSIPEPSVLAVLVLGAGAFALSRKGRGRKRTSHASQCKGYAMQVYVGAASRLRTPLKRGKDRLRLLNIQTACPPRAAVPARQWRGFASLFHLSTPGSFSVMDATASAMSGSRPSPLRSS